MTVTLALHEASLDHIGARLDALGLDVAPVPFDSTGRYIIEGKAVAPSEVDVDYLWFSSHLVRSGALKTAFELALTTRSVDVLQTFHAGLDLPFYRQASERGVRICNSSAQSVAIAEYVMGQVLSVYQPIERQRELQAARQWQQTPFRELSRSTWLIVGLGAIGGEVAKRAAAFGASTIGVRRSVQAGGPAERMGALTDLPQLLPEADVIVLACPLTEVTRGLAGEAFFRSAKQGATLINVGRGGLIHDEAMLAALDRGQLATAILDVFDTEPLPTDNPLWSHPGVRMTAHTSFNGDGVQERWDALFLDNIARYARGEALAREVPPGEI